MNYLPDTEAGNLLEQARIACKNTYSPYSHFAVGAAVLMRDGTIYTGANVENASYSVTICAERIAIGNAISAGNKEIVAVAVYSEVDTISPCGACRQFIIEWGTDVIVIFKHNKAVLQKTIGELLPYEFSFKDYL